ncbi:NUDIX domain-containing protein [Actinomycetaceae bacterium L2_0104]
MPKLVVGAAIVDSLIRPTRLLAAQRSYPEQLAGLWEFPGGKVEPGETPEAALRREIREELSTTLTLGRRIAGPADNRDAISADQPLRNAGCRAAYTSDYIAGEDPDVNGTATQSASQEDWPLPNGSFMRLWLATFPEASPAPILGFSHRELRWVRAAEIDSLPWLPGDVQILPAVRSFFL